MVLKGRLDFLERQDEMDCLAFQVIRTFMTWHDILFTCLAAVYYGRVTYCVINSLILLKVFDGKTQTKTCEISSYLQASAITASCDRLKKCLTQTKESCFSAACPPLSRMTNNFFSHWLITLLNEKRPQCFCVFAKKEDDR